MLIRSIVAVFIAILTPACAVKQAKPASDISILQKQMAEVSRKVENLFNRVSIIQVIVDEQQRVINDLKNEMKNEKEIDSMSSDVSSSLKSAEELYNQAFAFYKDKNYKEAHSLFCSISSNYPKHKLADNALYWAGECLYDQKKFSDALFSFEKVVKDYPESDKVPDSLLKIGYTYLALGDPAGARVYLIKVVKNHPFSPSGAKAEEKLKNMKMK